MTHPICRKQALLSLSYSLAGINDEVKYNLKHNPLHSSLYTLTFDVNQTIVYLCLLEIQMNKETHTGSSVLALLGS